MGLIDGLKRQLRSVIEWQETYPDQLFYQWTDNGDKIKNASQLIIGPGQGCIFVYEGVPKAMMVKSGIVNLQTDNIPFWTTIKKFMRDVGQGDGNPAFYVKCPVCQGFMQRKNFGARSGVIADRCLQHGVWLDGGELKRLMGWKKAGGQLLHEKMAQDKASEVVKKARSDHLAGRVHDTGSARLSGIFGVRRGMTWSPRCSGW